MRSKQNDNGSGSDRATTGYHGLFAHQGPDLLWLQEGFTKTGILYGHGLGAQVKALGSDGAPLSEAKSARAFTFGVTDLGPKTQFSPALIGEVSKDRCNKGDDYKLGDAQRTPDPCHQQQLRDAVGEGLRPVHGSGQHLPDKADGNFYKLTIALTFASTHRCGSLCAGTAPVGQLPRVDKELNGFSYEATAADRLAAPTFTGSSKWLLGAQMEVWFSINRPDGAGASGAIGKHIPCPGGYPRTPRAMPAGVSILVRRPAATAQARRSAPSGLLSKPALRCNPDPCGAINGSRVNLARRAIAVGGDRRSGLSGLLRSHPGHARISLSITASARASASSPRTASGPRAKGRVPRAGSINWCLLRYLVGIAEFRS